MKQKTFDRAEAERMAPLLRSIGTEIRDRTLAIRKLGRELEALQENAGTEGPRIGAVRSELMRHTRRVRAVRKEVERLGLAVDENHPLRIVVPCDDGGDWVYEGQLDGTNYYRLEGSTV